MTNKQWTAESVNMRPSMEWQKPNQKWTKIKTQNLYFHYVCVCVWEEVNIRSTINFQCTNQIIAQPILQVWSMDSLCASAHFWPCVTAVREWNCFFCSISVFFCIWKNQCQKINNIISTHTRTTMHNYAQVGTCILLLFHYDLYVCVFQSILCLCMKHGLTGPFSSFTLYTAISTEQKQSHFALYCSKTFSVCSTLLCFYKKKPNKKRIK